MVKKSSDNKNFNDWSYSHNDYEYQQYLKTITGSDSLNIWKKYNIEQRKEYSNKLDNYKFNLTVLYLNNNSSVPVSSVVPFVTLISHPTPNKIQKLKELIDEHFKRLNI